jgi:uncharacterized repeat protein (TIGR01451 family)
MKTKWNLLLVIFVIIGLVGAGFTPAQAQEPIPYYVTPGGSGDCTSWADACDLQTALTAARSGDEIWAAAGTYMPTSDPTDRAATFQLQDGVAVYGGFAGAETSRDERDPVANLTILSGDLNGDDEENFANNGENSYHVVIGANDATLDGVTITAGNADRTSSNLYGGGMYNKDSSPILSNIIFSGNSGTLGGGMYNQNSSPILSNITFSGNSASSYGGGGMYNFDNSSPTLTSVTFSENSANNGGGMVNNKSSSPTLSYVTFSKNSATWDGGGMLNYNNSSPKLTNLTFSSNSAKYGGGMYNWLKSSPALTNATFSKNTATWDGGGMYNYNESSPTLSNVTFSSNSANYGGGMYNYNNSSPALTNVTFSSNTAVEKGGGMFNNDRSSPTLTNVTFSGNSAITGGGGIYNYVSSSPVIRNTILWGNTGGELVNDGTSSATITSSVVQGGCPTGATCTNVIDTDPRLGVLGDYGGATQTLPLLPGSSAIDTGDDSLCPATDQRGVARMGVCDIGAFEYDYTGIYYVVPGGWGTQDGQSWADASDLQNALKTARSGDEIWAAAGVYKPTSDLTDRTATFQLKAGVGVYGGFAGTEASRDERSPQTNLTVLSGDLNGDDGENFANNGENSYHVVIGATGALLDGVTITAGNANGTTGSKNTAGGGMYNENSSPTLSNVNFSGNSAKSGGGMYNRLSSSPTLSNVTFSGNSAGSGGGMYNTTNSTTNSSPTLTNVTFSSNTATWDGGGMYNQNSSPILSDVTFSKNTARWDGGGMYSNSSLTLTNVTFSDNTAGDKGGGMYSSWSSPTLTGVTFIKNTARSGGGMYNSYSPPTLSNVTFSENTATLDGGGMYNSWSSSSTLSGVTFSSNSANYGGGMYNVNAGTPTLSSVTFNSNTAVEAGGGMVNVWSWPTLTNVTFSGNSAAATSSGNTAPAGGGIYNYGSSAPVIRNTILWGNTGGELVNDGTSSATITASVVQGGCPAGATCTNVIDTDPRLGVLGDYGGATQTIPLLPGSSAIDMGNNSHCPTTDQRGTGRVGACDIGAFESQGFTLAKTGGDNQSTAVNSAFADPLTLTVTANVPGEPVDGGLVTFTPPLTGASAAIDGSPAAISGGQASVTAAANNITGSYEVLASAAGAASESYALANLCVETIIVQNANDSGAGSLREAVANVCANGTITFAGDTTISLASTLTISHNLMIDGSGHSVTIRGDGSANVRLFLVNQGATAVLQHLTITNGGCYAGACDGGAILNTGNLTLNDSTLSGNMGRQGGAIFNSSALTVTNTTFSGNVAKDNYQTIGYGGAVFNSGTMTMTGSTFSGNEAYGSEGRGGAIFNINQLTVSSTTFSSNWAQISGGAIHAHDNTNTGFSSSTFINNSAGVGGAIYAFREATLTVANSTFSNNSATGSGGGLFNRGTATVTNSTFERTKLYNYTVSNPATLTVYNSIVAGPNDWNSPRCGEEQISGSHNLADDDSCGMAFTNSPTILLGELGSFGGSTQTIPLLPGSSAIDMGNSSLCPSTDQRGVPRPQGPGCDIGAFEKELAAVALSDLEHIYDGSPKAATAATIPAGLVVDVTYNGSPELPVNVGDYTVVATINDVQYMGSGTATLTILPVTADLGINNTDSKDPIKPGAKLVYTLVVSNSGPAAAQSVMMSDKLDSNTTYDSVSTPQGWTCEYNANSATVNCTSASLASGSTAVIKVSVTVNKNAKEGKNLVNTAQVSSVTYDPILANNSATEKTMVAK